MDKGHQAAGAEILLAKQMKVLLILSGTGQIAVDEAEAVKFEKGDCLLIPAAFNGVMQCVTECEYLVATVW